MADRTAVITTNKGAIRVDLRYGVDALDWLARAMSLAGAAAVLAALVAAVTRRDRGRTSLAAAPLMVGAAGGNRPASDDHGR